MVGQSLGVAVAATVLTNRIAYHGGGPAAHLIGLPQIVQDGTLTAYHDAFIVAGILTLAGVAMALFIRDKDAAGTMRPATVHLDAAPSLDEQELLPVGAH